MGCLIFSLEALDKGMYFYFLSTIVCKLCSHMPESYTEQKLLPDHVIFPVTAYKNDIKIIAGGGVAQFVCLKKN